MNYYLFKNPDGRPVNKLAIEEFLSGPLVFSLSEAEYNALNIANEQEIFDLKKQLADTDYIACKIAEGSATADEYSMQIAERRAWRTRINELEQN